MQTEKEQISSEKTHREEVMKEKYCRKMSEKEKRHKKRECRFSTHFVQQAVVKTVTISLEVQ